MKSSEDNSKKRFKLVHSNLYQIQPPAPPAPPSSAKAEPKKPIRNSAVLKTGEYNSSIRVNSYNANNLRGAPIQNPAPAEALPPHLALESLKQNLKTLNGMQARMRMLLKELEDLS